MRSGVQKTRIAVVWNRSRRTRQKQARNSTQSFASVLFADIDERLSVSVRDLVAHRCRPAQPRAGKEVEQAAPDLLVGDLLDPGRRLDAKDRRHQQIADHRIELGCARLELLREMLAQRVRRNRLVRRSRTIAQIACSGMPRPTKTFTFFLCSSVASNPGRPRERQFSWSFMIVVLVFPRARGISKNTLRM